MYELIIAVIEAFASWSGRGFNITKNSVEKTRFGKGIKMYDCPICGKKKGAIKIRHPKGRYIVCVDNKNWRQELANKEQKKAKNHSQTKWPMCRCCGGPIDARKDNPRMPKKRVHCDRCINLGEAGRTCLAEQIEINKNPDCR